MKPVIEDTSHPSTHRILLLKENLSINDIPENIRSQLKESECEFIENFVVNIDYDTLSIDEALRIIIPEEIENLPSAYEVVGHIAHLNLKDQYLPYKYQIGQVILDKIPNIRTVVNKASNIESKFRTFPMELLAGEKDYNVEVNHSSCKFRFNFEEVYWNSRLQTMHDKMIALCNTGETIADMFAGVGPFSIPLAKKKCIVYANDLNPASFKYLVQNAKLNKVTDYHFEYNMDGRDFIKCLHEKKIVFNHVIMNLPSTSIEFLDVFKELDWNYFGETQMNIHCYSFTNSEDHIKDLTERIEAVLGENRMINPKFDRIRNVSPKKWMYCISFILKINEQQFSGIKKQKISDE